MAAPDPSCRLPVRVTPKSSTQKIVWDGLVLRVWVSASPSDGQANEAVLKSVAKAIGIAPSRLSLVSGSHSRDKSIEVQGLELAEVIRRLGPPRID